MTAAVEGYVERIARAEASGWAWKPDAPDAPLQVELVLDGKVIAVAAADEPREDLLQAGKGDGRHGFRFELTRPLPLSKGTVPEFRVVGSGEVLPRLADVLDLSDLPGIAAAVEGAVNRITPTEACGWAWNPAAPDVALQIELVLDGKVIAVATADEPRDDLLRAGKSHGRYGFRFTLGPALRLTKARLPQFRVVGSGQVLPLISGTAAQGRQRAGKAAIEGVVGRITPTEARGWAWNPAAPNEALEIELVMDGAVVAVARADEPRDDLRRAGKGDGRHGFRFELNSRLPIAKGRVPVFRVRGGGQVVPRLRDAVDLGEAAVKPVPVEGAVEWVARTAATGWAWNPAAPGMRLQIELVLDGKVVAVATADEARDDLVHAGKGDGRHGFRFALYPPLPLAPGRVPALRVSGSDQVLPHLADSLDLSERLAIEGFVERISRTEASGWAWNPAAPDAPLQIELRFEGRRVAVATADAPRDDVMRAGKAGGRCGFHFVLGAPLPLASGKLPEFVDLGSAQALPLLPDALDLSEPPAEATPATPGTPASTAPKTPKTPMPPAPSTPTPPSATPTIAEVFTSAPPVQLRIDALGDKRVTGWAYDPVQPDTTQVVELLVDGKAVASAVASLRRPDLATAEAGGKPRGFEIAIPVRFFDGLPHTYQLRVGNSAATFPSQPTLQVLAPRSSSIAVNIEGLQGRRIRGWAWQPESPSEVVVLHVLIDGGVVEALSCAAYRADLKDAGIRGGHASFEFVAPQRFVDDRVHTLSIVAPHHRDRWAGYRTQFRLVPEDDRFDRRFGAGQILFAGTVAPRALPDQASIRADSAIVLAEGVNVYNAFRRLAVPPTVVVPVYNACDDARECIVAVMRETTMPARILAIDDGSPDRRVAPMLEELRARYPSLEVLRNPVNLGYTQTINRALREARGDVVLLNSDTIVGPRWLERLFAAAYRRPTIGTVTPLSDNAGAFSVPAMNEPNRFPDYCTPAQVARAVAAVSPGWQPNVPTGNGFCMYLKRAMIDEVGAFDEERFPRGYGEENDLCMRALRLGWEHVIEDKTIVFHKRSRSFREDRTALLEKSAKTIAEIHADYSHLTQCFATSPALREARSRIGELLERLRGPQLTLAEPPRSTKPRVLYLIHYGNDGGTTFTTEDLMRGVSSEFSPLVLTCDLSTLRLAEFDGKTLSPLGEWTLNAKLSYFDAWRYDYIAAVTTILLRYNIELVHVRQMFRHTMDVPAIASALNIPVIVSFHDFYYICPTINLLDDSGNYCGGDCTPGAGVCKTSNPWPEKLPPLKHTMIHAWRDQVRQFLPQVDAFVTTVASSKALHCRHFPELAERDFRVIEHGRDFANQLYLAAVPSASEKIRVLSIGHMTSRHKGGEVARRLKALDKADRLELHFLGDAPPEFATLGVCHGRYKREDLPMKVAEIRPSFVGLFTLWPETYSHTLSEAWACGVPVLGSELGAIGERIRTHGGGWVVDCLNVPALYEKILRIAENPHEYARQEARARIANLRTVAEMATDYRILYKEKIAAKHRHLPAVEGPAVLRVAVVTAGGARDLPLAVRRRWIEPLRHAAVAPWVEVTLVHPGDVADGRVHLSTDLLVVTTTANGALMADALDELRRRSKVRIAYDAAGEASEGAQSVDARRVALRLMRASHLAFGAGAGDQGAAVEWPSIVDERPWCAAYELAARPRESRPDTRLSVLVAVDGLGPSELSLIDRLAAAPARDPDAKWDLLALKRDGRVDLPVGVQTLPIPEGFEDDQDIATWLVTSVLEHVDVVLVPRLSSGTRPEIGYPEFALLRMPCLVSARADGDGVVVPDRSAFVAGDAVADWIDALKRIDRSRNLLAQVGDGGHRAVLASCSIARQPDRMVGFLRGLLRPDAARPAAAAPRTQSRPQPERQPPKRKAARLARSAS